MMMQPMMMQPMMGGPMMQQPMVQNAGPTFQQVSDNGKVAAKEETTVVEEQPIVQEDVTKAEERQVRLHPYGLKHCIKDDTKNQILVVFF